MTSCCLGLLLSLSLFFFNDTATTEIYTLSLHDALPIWPSGAWALWVAITTPVFATKTVRSEEHTSELQSQSNLVCRLLLEKKYQIRTCRSADGGTFAARFLATVQTNH